MPGFKACAIFDLQQLKERIEFPAHTNLYAYQLLMVFVHCRW